MPFLASEPAGRFVHILSHDEPQTSPLPHLTANNFSRLSTTLSRLAMNIIPSQHEIWIYFSLGIYGLLIMIMKVRMMLHETD